MKEIPAPRTGFEPISQMIRGYQLTQVLSTAMRHGIFSILDKPKSASILAEEISTDPTITEKLLEVLVSLELISKVDGEYLNSDMVRSFFVEDSIFYQGDMIYFMVDSYPLWSKLDLALKNGHLDNLGKGKREDTFDKRFIMASAEASIRGTLQDTVEVIAGLPEFKDAKWLLDLGGGHGLYSIAFAQRNPSLQAVVFDLPPVVEISREFIKDYGMEARVSVIAGDYLKDDLGSEYDLIFTSHSLFYQPREILEGSMNKVYNALKDNGVLVINHWIRQKNKNSVVSSLWDLRLTLLGSPHYLYSKEEYLDLLRKCGFVEKDIIHLPTLSNPTVIIVARKENRRELPPPLS
ncbi:MAG: class I SAM-dependent methyltransferase [Thermodesulfobacteriota bacterium]|nr:class I SAM-dependent methyltransferase [Thermodesulfobacteriota bacterium]